MARWTGRPIELSTALWEHAPSAGGGNTMRPKFVGAAIASVTGLVVVAVILPCLIPGPVHAGEQPSISGYKVLEPIRHGSLTVFPIVVPKSYSTGEFMTLDEGLRSGEVVVTEYGNVRGLVRSNA